MVVDLETDSGAKVSIYRFTDFPADATTALVITHFDHLLTDEERTGWTGYGEGGNDPIEYPPAMMAVNDWFGPDGEALE